MLAQLVNVTRLPRREPNGQRTGQRRQVAQDQSVGLCRGIPQSQQGREQCHETHEDDESPSDDELAVRHPRLRAADNRMRGSTQAMTRSAARFPSTTIRVASSVVASTTGKS